MSSTADVFCSAMSTTVPPLGWLVSVSCACANDGGKPQTKREEPIINKSRMTGIGSRPNSSWSMMTHFFTSTLLFFFIDWASMITISIFSSPWLGCTAVFPIEITSVTCLSAKWRQWLPSLLARLSCWTTWDRTVTVGFIFLMPYVINDGIKH